MKVIVDMTEEPLKTVKDVKAGEIFKFKNFPNSPTLVKIKMINGSTFLISLEDSMVISSDSNEFLNRPVELFPNSLLVLKK